MIAHSDFVHLHVHTKYSLLDGACKIPDLLNLAKKYKMPALAITDHGNMFGAIEFYTQAMAAGIKPIIGCEIYIAPKSRFDKSARLNKNSFKDNHSPPKETAFHLILLVKDEKGYKNLIKLVSIGYLEGFYYRPRIDNEILSQNCEGLIGLTSCLKGEIPFLLKNNKFNEALKKADEYKNIFGKDNFYLELQDNFINEQRHVNKNLVRIAKELNLGIVATNDVHYLEKDMARAHEMLLCIQTQTTLNDTNRMRLQTDEFYFKSPEQMKELFKEFPEAITNTLRIAQRCNLELDFNKLHLPRYDPPDGKTKEEFLVQLCRDGLKKFYNGNLPPEITRRLKHELKIINDMGFVSYFLIVWDFIHFAKQNNIPVGPGRGSAAGSLVSYLLGITDIDPLKYGLLFERFLNPQRLGLPDIDIDFCYERRNDVIDYVTKKYGRHNVAQIITFGTMQARAAVRDVGRVMGMSYQDVDKIAKLIPPEPNIKLKDAIESEPDLKSLYKNDSQIKQLLDTALVLEGLSRHASVHAAGVVIADKPLTDYLPLYKTNDDQITTGYSMGNLEKIGLLKVDFLGLRTLTVIDRTIKIIKETKSGIIDINKIPLDDEKTFKLLCQAHTIGVFQLESSGMRDLLKKLQPQRFEDLIALLALYRPGPMGSGMLDDFIMRRHNKISVRYDHKDLEEILKSTYGIVVYQEQVMQIASRLAGFSLAQADLLRRAMSKKIPEVMERNRTNFVEGCHKNKIDKKTAYKIFDLIEYFSGYGFNRSHSTAYALISYRTAYLKARYPVEFMAALLSSERDNTDKIVVYVNEAMRMGIEILPPDINESIQDFSVAGPNSIRFGLLAIKNIGTTSIESILEARKNGKFKSLSGLCQRVDLRLVNRKVLESLIKCGAMDCFGLYRAQLMAMLDNVLNISSKIQSERSKGQLSFFDETDHKNLVKGFKEIPGINEWPEPQVLAFEKELLGFYVSGHPLAKYARKLKRFNSIFTNNINQYPEGREIKVAGLIVKIKYTLTRKKAEKMAIIKVEDLQGDTEILVFPRVFRQVSNFIQNNSAVFVKGRLNFRGDSPKLVANDIFPIENAYNYVNSVSINISDIKENLFKSLKDIISKYQGQTPVFFYLERPHQGKVKIAAGQEHCVKVTEDLLEEIEQFLGEEKITLLI